MKHLIYLENCDSFDYAHAIPIHNGKCAGVHGHTAVVRRVELEGPILSDGMIMDLALLKEAVRNIVSRVDHKFIIGKQYSRKRAKQYYIHFSSHLGQSSLYLPEAQVIRVQGEATIEVITSIFLKSLQKELGMFSFHSISVTISEGEDKGATASYP